MKKRITNNSIFYLKSKENLIRYMDLHGKRVTNNPNASILFACPFCNSGNHERRNSDSGFSIYSNRNGYGKYHCFSCDRHGDIINVHAELHGKNPKNDFLKICEEIAKELCITLDYEDGSTFQSVSSNQKVIVKQSSRRAFNHVDFTPKNQDKELKQSSRVERQHVYTNENGQSIAIKKMKIRKDGSKSFIWYLINPETGEIASKYGLNGLELPLYNICAVNQAKENGQIVFVVEGEKDVDTLQSLGYTATTKPNGAQNNWTANFINPLKDLNVVVLLDNDQAGASCGEKAITALFNVTTSLKVIPSAYLYPELPNKGDISDIVDILGAEKTKEILNSAITDKKYLVTEDTSTNTKQDDDANNEENSKKETKQQFDCDYLENFLQNNQITAKYNEISTDIDIEINGDLFKHENQEFISEMLPSLLEVPLKTAYKGANINNITRYLDIVAKRHTYNPVLELIQSVKWDGHDYFNDFCDMLGIGEQMARKTDAETYAKYAFYRQGIFKWLMQCICGLHNTKFNPFSLDIVLVLQGGQGISKTRLFENLALKPQFFGDGTSIDPRNKDTLLEALSKWICELGEIGSTFKKDIDLLKAFITHAVDEIRRPYDRKASRIARHTSFCGSVNDDKYLIDETGNRRFFTIKLPESLVIDYETQIKPFKFLQLWAQINAIVETHIQNGETYAGCFRLSDSEKRTLQIYNAEHEKPLKGEIEIRDTIYKLEGNPKVMHRYMTITEFLTENLALKNITAMQAGKVLNRLQYQPKRVYRNGNTSTVYNLPYISYSYP